MQANLKNIIAKLERMGRFPRGYVFDYDLMSDSIIWEDEKADFDPHELNFMREVWSYRAGMYISEHRVQYHAAWCALHELFPEWIGFDPSRITPNREALEVFVRERERSSRRMDRYRKAEDGSWRPLSGIHPKE